MGTLFAWGVESWGTESAVLEGVTESASWEVTIGLSSGGEEGCESGGAAGEGGSGILECLFASLVRENVEVGNSGEGVEVEGVKDVEDVEDVEDGRGEEGVGVEGVLADANPATEGGGDHECVEEGWEEGGRISGVRWVEAQEGERDQLWEGEEVVDSVSGCCLSSGEAGWVD